MNRLVFEIPAEEALARLGRDDAQKLLYDRVNDALDLLEDDPSDGRVRRRQYRDPKMWGIVVRGRDEDWLILWDQVDDLVTVLYIGPDLA